MKEMISKTIRSDRGTPGTGDPSIQNLTPTNLTLPKKNTVIPSDPATPSQRKNVTSYTNQYLSDLKPA